MRLESGRPWFNPKRHGYGANPATWQGWAATAAFVALSILDVTLIDAWFRWAGLAVLTILFAVFVRSRTSGPWRWRWRWRR